MFAPGCALPGLRKQAATPVGKEDRAPARRKRSERKAPWLSHTHALMVFSLVLISFLSNQENFTRSQEPIREGSSDSF